MKHIINKPAKLLVQILCISLCSLAATSCSTSKSENEFESQHGFKPDAYFGTQQNTDHIPQQVRDVAR